MNSFWQDIRYGLRMLQKSPGFTLVAVLTLGLGIGANTTLFSVVNGVLLNPLPFPHPEELVRLHESKVNFATGSISYPNFRDWQSNNRTFSAMAISRSWAFSLTGTGEAERVVCQFVSSDFFPILGMNAKIGRLFGPGEDEIGRTPIVVISEGLWKRKLGGSSDALGKVLTLDGKNYTIVGVMPASLDLAVGSFRPSDVYVPIGQWGNPLLQSRAAGLGIHGLGRLKPGVTVAQAQADMDSVTHHLTELYPDADKGIGARVFSLRQEMLGRVQPFLLVLLAAVGFVLLISCVNVANLMLARATSRTREFAVRAALGATRKRVVRQLLAESMLLAVAGGALGLLLATWGVQSGLQLLPTALPRANDVAMDGRVLAFTVTVSLLAGILFGLFPALRMSKPDIQETLQEGGRGGSGIRSRAHGALVVTEMALALVLLCGAGLMIRTLERLWSVDPGFEPHNVLTFGASLSPSLNTASVPAIREAYRQFHDQLRAVPGVKAVSFSGAALPLLDDDERLFWMEGQPRPTSANDMNWALSYIVGPEYLTVMRIPLLRGRFFTTRDDEHSTSVAVVDDVFARKYFGDSDPIGKHINLDDGQSASGPAEIIGVVGHVKQWGLDNDDTQELRAQMYTSYLQFPDESIAQAPSGMMAVVVRGELPSQVLFDALRQATRRISSDQVLYNPQTMEEVISESFAARTFTMTLLGIFAAVALILASVGIYGVISFLVGQRTREFAIRLALGAQRGDVLRTVLGQGFRMAMLGVAVGLAAAVGVTRLLTQSSMLFGVSATDPVTFGGVAVLLTLVALLACYVPARRATKVDPLVALRYE